MTEPLGIALELMQRRKALAARLSPQARRLAFPDIHRVEVERRQEIKYRINRIKSDWAVGKRVTAREKAMAMEPQTRLIVQTCARIWGVPAGMIYSEGKPQVYVLPRRAAMALMRDVLGMTLPAIGITLNRDHTTVVHALERHKDSYELMRDYQRKFDEVEAEVRPVFQGNATTSDTVAASGEVDGRTERPSHPSLAEMKRAA